MEGAIYILTNPSFPDYVKIGYADNIDRRLKELNRSECIPFSFRVYATYEVEKRLTDLKIHNVIDTLNPNLRSIETINGRTRKREFYAITPEEAYALLEAIAQIDNRVEYLHKKTMSEKERKEEKEAKSIRSPSDLYKMGLKNGDELIFIKDQSKKCIVSGPRKVMYDDKDYSLPTLASKFLGKKRDINGYVFFTYRGEKLWNLRLKIESEAK